MITVTDAKIIAGKILAQSKGEDFVRTNIGKRLFTTCMDEEDSFIINFELFDKSIENDSDNEETVFPDIILSVDVDKENGVTTILG